VWRSCVTQPAASEKRRPTVPVAAARIRVVLVRIRVVLVRVVTCDNHAAHPSIGGKLKRAFV